MAKLVKIKFDNGYLVLKGSKWLPTDKSLVVLAKFANILSKPPMYEYSPAHGAYGYQIANELAEKFGGEAILPKIQESEEEVIY